MIITKFTTGINKGELTIESVCLLMEIVSCRNMNFECNKSQCTIKHCFKKALSQICADFINR